MPKEIRRIEGRDVLNPSESGNSLDYLRCSIQGFLLQIIDRAYWFEDEAERLEKELEQVKAENKRLMQQVSMCRARMSKRDISAVLKQVEELENDE